MVELERQEDWKRTCGEGVEEMKVRSDLHIVEIVRE